MLEVRLLGQFDVLRNGKRLTIPTRNAQSLFAYLVLTAGKAHRRERLAGLLWADSNEENARSNLRHELWRLRKALETEGKSYFLVDDLTIAFQPQQEYALDVHQLESAPSEDSTADDLIAALSAYHGELLPGFYDEWVIVERDRLHALFEAKTACLLEMLESEERWAEVLDWGMRWTALGQWPEPAYRALMSAYASSGDLPKVAATYGRLTQGLQKDLGIKPSEQTQALYKRLMAGGRPEAPTRKIQSPAGSPSSMLERRTSRHSDLPRPLTPLLGREQDVAAVRDSLLHPDTHLLTLTGPPGIGKTRLSIQVASELVEHFKDGVSFIPLAPINDPDLVAITISQTLSIIESGDWKPITALKNYFREKSMLLVLDNFEQVLMAAPLVAELLQSCPGLKMLTTSRAPLKISGERQYPLAPLQLPNLERLPSLETLATIPSIALFIARAGQVDPQFTLTETNAGIVAEICHHLDGLPLAIELAAAWIKLLPPQQLLDRLSNRLSLLIGGPVDLPPRQRTLRAAIDWSYQLLDSWEQTLLARLTIFAGGWTLEAAGAVVAWNDAGVKDGSPGDILGGLLNLVDKSLVKRQEHAHGQVRFNLLDTICEYATEKLAARGEREILEQRHATCYLELAEASEPALRGSQQQLWLTLLKNEHNNLRTALQWALDHQDAERALKLAGSLWRYWWMHGHLSEGRNWLEKALAIPSSQHSAWRARALNGAGVIARSQGDYANARVFLQACLEIQRDLQDRKGMAAVLNSLGVLAQYQGDYDLAFEYHNESLAHRREIGDARDIAVSLNNMAMLAQEKGTFAQAEKLYSEGLTLFKKINDARDIAATLANMGALKNDQGDARQAEAFCRSSLSILKNLGQRDDIIECLEGFAGVGILLGQPRRAARLFGAAQALREVIGAPVPPYKHARYRRFLESLAAHLDPETLESDLMIGKNMSLDEAIDYALNERF